MLEELVTSKTRRALLVLFMLNPKNEFYLRELARKTNAQPNAVKRELEKLLRAGLVSSEKKGNALYFKTNARSPVFEELKRIVLKTEGLGSVLKQEFKRLKASKGESVRFAFVYGSFAKSEERGSSDIDVMIIGSVPPKKILSAVRRIEEKIGREVNYAVYPPAEILKSKENGFLSEVLKGKKVMLEGDENELKRFVEGRQD